jgi:hypothetical protein
MLHPLSLNSRLALGVGECQVGAAKLTPCRGKGSEGALKRALNRVSARICGPDGVRERDSNCDGRSRRLANELSTARGPIL